ncbi:transferase hexapeptide repeat family protein [uncultured Croceitalea sp.]|uniref:acyltransferase n=1 Tax=uncultured Croceitalea sp. TaxID=1798908 RepID=UPI00374FBA51
MIYSFKGYIPVVHKSSFVHPLAAVTGNVIIGKHCYVGPGAAIRGDWGQIILKDGVNVQENCTVHMFPGKSIILDESAHIGHGAIIHGANIGKNVLVGMNTVIMDDTEIGDESIIGAMAFIKAETKIPRRSLVVGNPGKIVKEVTDDMIAWKTKGTQLYQKLPAECHDSLKEVEPLREIPKDRTVQDAIYDTLRGFMKK